MEFEASKRHVLRLTLSPDVVQRVLRWERQRRCCFDRIRPGHVVKKYCSNKKVMNFFWGREDEEKRRQKNGQLDFSPINKKS